MIDLLLVQSAGLALAGVLAAQPIPAKPYVYPPHTLFVNDDASMRMDGRLVTAADVKKQFGCKETVLLKASKSAGYKAFMRVVNELQAQKCLKVGLIVEDASPSK